MDSDTGVIIMKKTKIICTIGPACNNIQTLKDMVRAGMDVARLNFSHGDFESQLANIQLVREVRKLTGRHIGIMLDTKGPEIRTGIFEKPEVLLEKGQTFTLRNKECVGTEQGCFISYPDLYKYMKPGDRILIDDGLIELIVTEIRDGDIISIVQNSGIVKNHKGINVPGVQTNLPGISQKDLSDILFGIEQGIDYIAASFIRTADHVKEIRTVLNLHQGSHIRIIAKIENQEGLDHLDEIIAAADGIMVARGDLGVEIPMEQVPVVQKKIISKCVFAGKPVITATQMLDSMIRNPRPTRAEVADVANAVFDGTSAIMLSGETASGSYPVEAVDKMREIAQAAEGELDYNGMLEERGKMKNRGISDAIGYSTCASALGLKAVAILAPTESGTTPREISKYRPKVPIIATTPYEITARRLTMNWGVVPILTRKPESAEDQLKLAEQAALDAGYVRPGDLVILATGLPVGVPGHTNMMRVHIVGQNS